MKKGAFDRHMLKKFTTAKPNRRSIGTLVQSAEARTPSMMLGMEEALQLQKDAAEIKAWLRDHPTADRAAIEEQRRRLKEILQKIAGTVQ